MSTADQRLMPPADDFRPRRRSAPNACAALLGLLALEARAQDNAIGGADDAFGSRIGQESIGLYSESLVRGFDLQQAGNYRIGDTYFVRAASPPGGTSAN